MKEMIEKIIISKCLMGQKVLRRNLKDADEEVLIVSQFTLAAITNKGTNQVLKQQNLMKQNLYDKFVEFENYSQKLKRESLEHL